VQRTYVSSNYSVNFDFRPRRWCRRVTTCTFRNWKIKLCSRWWSEDVPCTDVLPSNF